MVKISNYNMTRKEHRETLFFKQGASLVSVRRGGGGGGRKIRIRRRGGGSLGSHSFGLRLIKGEWKIVCVLP